MKKLLTVLLTVLCCASLFGCAATSPSEAIQSASAGGRFADQIADFEIWDSKNAIPDRAVLFVGSSSIRLWKTTESFPGLPVINRGFGGSQFFDLNGYFDRIVTPYSPEVIVVYEGDNDISDGKTSQEVLDGYMAFVAKVQEALPKTRVVFIPIKPSLARWELWPQMSEANMWIRDVAGRDPLLFYADTATPMLLQEGTPDPSLFLDDGLHLNAKGYALWTEHLMPVLRDARRIPLP
jgi:hypothetical protein